MTPSEHEAEGGHGATCDACGEFGICIEQGDASVCRKCQAFHERAVLAAAEALYLIRGVRLGAYPFPTWDALDELDRAIFRTDASAAVDAYFAFTDDPARPTPDRRDGDEQKEKK